MGGKRDQDILGMDAPFAGEERSEDETQQPIGMGGGAPRIARVRRDWDESDLVTEPPWEVYGKTVAEVRESLHSLGEEWGRGGGQFTARFEDEKDGSVTAVVSAQFTKILPTWKDEEEADAAARERWGTMIAALDRHEQRHVDIAAAAVEGFAAELPGTLCSGIQNRQNRAEKKLQAAQKKLDDDSDHARKAGHPYGGVDY